MASISAAFDSGNIEVVDSTDASNIRLRVRSEPFTEGTDKKAHLQVF